MKDVALWLPQAAAVELRALRIDAGAEVASRVRTGRRWVHYGSSISHCMEAATPLGIWPAVAARRAGVELLSLGFAGQCHLDGFVARTIRELDADCISAKVGINIVNADSMKERCFVPALHAFLDTIRERKPVTPILLVSPILCPIAEDHVGPTVRAGDHEVVLDGPPNCARVASRCGGSAKSSRTSSRSVARWRREPVPSRRSCALRRGRRR